MTRIQPTELYRLMPKPVASSPQFAGLYRDLRKQLNEQDRLERQSHRAAEEAEAAAGYPSLQPVLNKVYFERGKQPLSGLQVLELVDDLLFFNRVGLVPNLKRLGATLIFGSLIGMVPYVIYKEHLGEDEPLSKLFDRSYTAGVRTHQLQAAVGFTPSYEYYDNASVLRELEQAGLLKAKDSRRTQNAYYLTAKGRRVLKYFRARMGQSGLASSPPFSQVSQSPTAASGELVTPLSGPDHRLAVLRELISEVSPGGAMGWRLLKELAKAQAQRSLRQRWLGQGIPEARLMLQTPLEHSSSIPEKLQKLQRLGLIESRQQKGQTAPTWKLTLAGNRLVGAEGPFQALSVTREDLKSLIQKDIDALKVEKQSMGKTVGEAQQKLTKQIQELKDAEALYRESLADVQKLERPADGEKALQLEEQLFSLQLQEKRIAFLKRREQQEQAYLALLKAKQAQRVQEINANLLGLHDSLWQLEQQEGDASIDQLVANLNRLAPYLNRETQTFAQWVAQLAPVPLSEEEVATALAVNQQLSQAQLTDALFQQQVLAKLLAEARPDEDNARQQTS